MENSVLTNALLWEPGTARGGCSTRDKWFDSTFLRIRGILNGNEVIYKQEPSTKPNLVQRSPRL